MRFHFSLSRPALLENKHPALVNTRADAVIFRLATIAREEGVKALWKGFVPKVLRLAPGGGVLLLVVEFTLSTFRTSEICPSP